MFDLFKQLDEDINRNKFKPNNLQNIYFMFWEKGISLEEFNRLPLPYIFDIIQTSNFYHEQAKKEAKKNELKNGSKRY